MKKKIIRSAIGNFFTWGNMGSAVQGKFYHFPVPENYPPSYVLVRDTKDKIKRSFPVAQKGKVVKVDVNLSKPKLISGEKYYFELLKSRSEKRKPRYQGLE